MESALSDPRCNGKAYSSIADRIRDLRVPVAQAHLVAFEAIQNANAQNMAALQNLPETSPGVLDTDECDRLIEDVREQNRRIQEMHEDQLQRGVATQFIYSSYSDLYDMNNEMISLLEEKKQAAFDYDTHSSTLYSDAKSCVTSILSGSTATVDSYLENGSFGDQGWKTNLDDMYAGAHERWMDQVLLALSNADGGIAIMSDDCQFIYYKGVKWEIDGFEDSDEGGEWFKAVFSEVDSIVFSGDIFFRWQKYLSGAKLSDLKITSQMGNGFSGDERAASTVRVSSALTEAAQQAVDCFDRAHIKFVFESDGAQNRVKILARTGEQWKRDYSFMGAGPRNGVYYVLPENPGSHVIIRDWATCDAVYYQETGRHLIKDKDYTIRFTPDRDRGVMGSYYDRIYYSEDEGAWMSVPIMFPEDKYEICGEGFEQDCRSAFAPVPEQANEDYAQIMNGLQFDAGAR